MNEGGEYVKDKPRLGRGLDALFNSTNGGDTAVATEQAVVPVGRIQHNPYQPRKEFDADELAGLSASIKSHGVLQPLVVRQVGDEFQLIAGERRLRAAQTAGFDSVPVRIVDFNDRQVLEAALAENIQRSDLNPIEKAVGFKDYLDRFGTTQDQLADSLGLDRSTITHLLGLLELEPEVQEAVRLKQITMGHAKILKGIRSREKQVAICREIIARGLSVHATETLIKQPAAEPEKPSSGSQRSAPEKTAHVLALEDELHKKLVTRVEIRVQAKDKGQIVIGFDSNDDFERLVDLLRR